MAIILWALLACVLAALILAISLPLTLWLRIDKAETWSFRAALQPFGRIGPRIALKGRSKPRPKKPPAEKKAKGSGRSVDVPSIIRLLRDFLASIRLHRLRVEADFGTGDPALTGEAYGALMPLIYASRPFPRIEAQITPHFDERLLRGRAELALSLTPITLVGPVFRFGWSMMRGTG